MNKGTYVILILFSFFIASTPIFAGQAKNMIPAAENGGESAGNTVKGAYGARVENTAADSVDLNFASREQLLTLPGIGENEASRIIGGRPYYMKTELIKKGIISSELFYGIVGKVTIDLAALDREKKKEEKKALEARMKGAAKKVKTRSGLVYQDIVPGTGKGATAGKTVTVDYTGWLTDGTKFDSSKDRNVPYTFVLGRGEVIKGWDEGIQSMKVGGKRRLIVPPKLGYGKKGAGNVIPPDATLIFEVELIEIRE